MDMNVIRGYIVADDGIYSLISDNVFLFEKPEAIICNDYVTYNFKEINGGSSIRDYQLDLRIVSKNKLKLFDIKDRLIEILDNFNRPTAIANMEQRIRHTRLINGGGIVKNEETGEYYLLVYFLVKV